VRPGRSGRSGPDRHRTVGPCRRSVSPGGGRRGQDRQEQPAQRLARGRGFGRGPGPLHRSHPHYRPGPGPRSARARSLRDPRGRRPPHARRYRPGGYPGRGQHHRPASGDHRIFHSPGRSRPVRLFRAQSVFPLGLGVFRSGGRDLAAQGAFRAHPGRSGFAGADHGQYRAAAHVGRRTRSAGPDPLSRVRHAGAGRSRSLGACGPAASHPGHDRPG